MLTTDSFFNLNSFQHAEAFASGYVWETLKRLKDYMADQKYPAALARLPQNTPLPETYLVIDDEVVPAAEFKIVYGDATKGKLAVFQNDRQLIGAAVIMAGTVLSGGQIKIGAGALIESGALLKSPAIIGACTEVRQGAYLRGHCLVGQRCVVGHVTEVKHSIFLNDAKAGHFAYLGDSILGNEVNLGAGTKLANLRFTGGEVPVRTLEGVLSTGLRKLGAILADQVQTGCNSVTNPGALLGRKSMLMPNTTAPSGYHPPNSLIRG